MTDALLDALAHPPRDLPPEAGSALSWTLADHLACVLGATQPGDNTRGSAFGDDGVTGTASLLSLRAASSDRDDVDWDVLTHPGSVVWATTLAMAAQTRGDGETIARAAFLGYRAISTMAHLFGPAHRARWHVTATAGGFGAAAAAGAVLGLAPHDQAAAFAHTAAATGGIGQAAVERRGAGAFNRAAAVALGIQAVRAAVFGAVHVDAPLDGERALLTLLASAPSDGARGPKVVDGLGTVSPRVYPVSGFAQGAVLATATLSARVGGTLRELVVEVAEPAVRLLNGSCGGAWWSLSDAVAAAWNTGDPFLLEPSEESRLLVDRVRILGSDLPVGAARVRVVTDRGAEQCEATAPGVGPDLSRKWSTMLAGVGRSEDVAALAEEILHGGVGADHLALLTASRRTPATERFT